MEGVHIRESNPSGNSPESPLAFNNLVTQKLQERMNSSKPLDILLSDVDGTLYIRNPQGAYIGKNPETRRELAEKKVPLIVNTGRPAWDEYEDIRLEGFSLPRPDAVIAGTGTMIYWRDTHGQLRIDEEYADRIAKHKIQFKTGPFKRTATFDPRVVTRLVLPELQGYGRENGIVDLLVDEGPLLSNGKFGIEGLRLVARDMPYSNVKVLIQRMKRRVSGIKVDFSEISEESTEESFTGWLHVVPTIAGKDEAARYVLNKIHAGMNLGAQKINAHIVGDASNDMRVLTMGTHPDKHPYKLHQYGLNNLAPYTRGKIEKVINALSEDAENNRNPQANVTLLEGNGPDGVYQIVHTLQ